MESAEERLKSHRHFPNLNCGARSLTAERPARDRKVEGSNPSVRPTCYDWAIRSAIGHRYRFGTGCPFQIGLRFFFSSHQVK